MTTSTRKKPSSPMVGEINDCTVESEDHLHQDNHIMRHRIDRLEDQMNERLSGMTDAFFDELKELRVFMIKGGAWILGIAGTIALLLFTWEWEQAQVNAEAHKQAAVLNAQTAVQLVAVTSSVQGIQTTALTVGRDLQDDIRDIKDDDKDHLNRYHIFYKNYDKD